MLRILPIRVGLLRCMSSDATAQVKISAQTQALLDKILRVDHAGEFGAIRIYRGQLAVLGRSNVGPILTHMLKQEENHFSIMNDLIPAKRVRPSLLLPIWSVAGYLLGAGTALLGKEGAMACTVAVETVIGEHYDNQIRELIADGEDGVQTHKTVIELLSRLRDEELEHLQTGVEQNAEQAPFYKALTETIKVGCRGAVWLAEKI